MKIVFITSSLEPGRDGVGDYTRRLAGIFIKLGHSVTALCLNDQFIFTEVVGHQDIDGVQLDVIRIPFNWQHEKRMARAKHWIGILNPDWLSLQFVIFSFHNKGLPFKISNSLRELGKERHWHIMFHELWVGINNKTSLKLFLWGFAQQQIIKQLIHKLKPKLINTHTKLYQVKLSQLGFAVPYLPLFGNIYKVNTNFESIQINRLKTIRLVLFGTIHPGAPIQEFIQELLAYQQEYKVHFELVIVGRTGSQSVIWVSAFKNNNITVEVLGELSTENISTVLSNSTFGISTTPIEFAEKSGTIAAMREHGLIVLCIADQNGNSKFKDFISPVGVFNYYKGCLKETIKNVNTIPSNCTVEIIGLKLSTTLSEKLKTL